MKDTELDYVVAHAREGGGWKSVETLASLDGKLLALKISPPLSAAYYPKSGEYARPLARNTSYGLPGGSQRRNAAKTVWQKPVDGFWVLQEKVLHLSRKKEVSSQKGRHASNVQLLTSCQLQIWTDAQVRYLLCYPLPAAPLW